MQTERVDKAEVEFFQQIQSLIKAVPTFVPEHFSKICGVDADYSKKDKRVVATVVLFRDGLINEARTYKGEFTFPYISGLFSFMKARSLLPP